jgi:uncharacterized NAD(P)/FAD-binding protein YdhS
MVACEKSLSRNPGIDILTFWHWLREEAGLTSSTTTLHGADSYASSFAFGTFFKSLVDEGLHLETVL